MANVFGRGVIPDMNGTGTTKKYLMTVFKVTVSAVLIYWIFSHLDRQAFIENFSKIDLSLVPLVVTLLILNYVVSSYRWKSLLIHKGGEKVTVEYLTSLYFIGSFFNNFMPTSIGGDVYKIYMLGKKIKSHVNAFAATFMERFTGVLILVLISIVSLYAILKIYTLILLVWFVLGFYYGLRILTFLSKKHKFFKKIHDSLMVYKGENKVLLWASLTSVLVQLIAIMTQYVIFISLGVKIPIMYALFSLPLITLASFFIPSLNGVGVQDALYITMFGYLGVPSALAASASILYHLFRLGVSLIGGVFYALGRAD